MVEGKDSVFCRFLSVGRINCDGGVGFALSLFHCKEDILWLFFETRPPSPTGAT